MGLGGYPALSLAGARSVAQRWRTVAAEGRDPVKEREAEARAARREDVSLAVLTADAFEARKAELKGDGKAGRWLSPLNGHVLPKLGKVPVTDIDQRDIRDTLASIWHTKADTARKAMNRLNIVFRHAAALGLDVDLQATACSYVARGGDSGRIVSAQQTQRRAGIASAICTRLTPAVRRVISISEPKQASASSAGTIQCYNFRRGRDFLRIIPSSKSYPKFSTSRMYTSPTALLLSAE
nr:integrase arm-type DNA-binding domain-containing protein [Ruegeria sp. Alg231-54]